MVSAPDPTFRDPAGSVRIEAHRVVRTIASESRQAVLSLLDTAFLSDMQQRGDVISATTEEDGDGLRLIHPLLEPITYPWEWTAGQWAAAGDLTLRLGEEALAAGWVLKDATPLNVLFVGPRPVLVDLLSFEPRDPKSSLWIAYGQYVRSFLLPLLANKLLSWPLELAIFRRDGYEPADLHAALGWTQRLSPDIFWPVTLPTWLEKKRKPEDASATIQAARLSDPDATAHVLRGTLRNLRKRTARAVEGAAKSNWSDYPASLTHYTAAEMEAKHAWVRAALEELRPARVLDLGANTGDFSALAASCGAQVVAIERDAAAAERLFRRTLDQQLAVQTVHADLARPTPAAGWCNAEQTSLLDRLEGGFDLVLMLAVIHHLILMEQIPIPAILDLCTRLTRRYLVLEWVPATDPMYISLMRGRDDLYGRLTLDNLLAAAQGRFSLVRQQTLTNGRSLLLLEKLH